MDAQYSPEAFAESMQRLQLARYIAVAVLAYTAIDYLGTVPREINLIWQSRWSLVKVVFLLSRYLLFIDVPLNVMINEFPGLSPNACTGIIWTVNAVSFTAIALGEGIMCRRVYALSKQRRSVKVFLITFWMAMQAVLLTLSVFLLRSLKFAPVSPGMPDMLNRCFIVGAGMNFVASLLSVSLAIQVVITGLGLFFVYTNFKHSKGQLIRAIYQDGVLYLVVMAAVLIAGVVACLALPIEFKLVAPMASRAFHGTLGNRILLNMREASERDMRQSTPVTQESELLKHRGLEMGNGFPAWAPPFRARKNDDLSTTAQSTTMRRSEVVVSVTRIVMA